MLTSRDPEGVADSSQGSKTPGRSAPQWSTLEGCQNPVVPSTYTSLYAHLIFSTKNRAPVIAEAWRDDLHAYIGGTLRGLGATPLAIGGIADHVHALISFGATHCIADLVREPKEASSVWAAQRAREFAWQLGYAAFTVGPTQISSVRQYLGAQEEHHRHVSPVEELKALLAEFGVAYDERYFE